GESTPHVAILPQPELLSYITLATLVTPIILPPHLDINERIKTAYLEHKEYKIHLDKPDDPDDPDLHPGIAVQDGLIFYKGWIA
ncbi:hypothetical protein BGZ76_006926, partial [Entomortierella beljakovae]